MTLEKLCRELPNDQIVAILAALAIPYDPDISAEQEVTLRAHRAGELYNTLFAEVRRRTSNKKTSLIGRKNGG